VQALGAAAAYKIWSGDYDRTPNALLALEMRILSARLGVVKGQRILDAGSGTGRWMAWAEQRGARVFGVDACHEMILQAGQKPGLAGRSACADVRRIPLRDDAADIALCSFTLGYLESPRPLFRELARIARRVIVSDLHPAAVLHGWTRSFRVSGERYQLHHYEHSAADLDTAARAEGLTLDWRVESSFDEPERLIFQQAGKESAFEDARLVPAVLVTAWSR
jgi:ubiquinone/menaquinone biosynthesis C-methylase UbiE